MRRKFRTALLTAVLVGCAPAVGFAADAGAEVRKGRALAERLCARCHAVGQSGESPLQPAPRFRDLSKKWPIENLEEALAEGIVVGHEAMPEFELNEAQIDAFLAYLKTLKSE